ncbi:MAG: hypothetical protein HQL56_03720 [Magnetococcales bacterium]|nr:hypothetical protein [Magnetococcales bacterium]
MDQGVGASGGTVEQLSDWRLRDDLRRRNNLVEQVLDLVSQARDRKSMATLRRLTQEWNSLSPLAEESLAKAWQRRFDAASQALMDARSAHFETYRVKAGVDLQRQLERKQEEVARLRASVMSEYAVLGSEDDPEQVKARIRLKESRLKDIEGVVGLLEDRLHGV